jgi:hypothetical protein
MSIQREFSPIEAKEIGEGIGISWDTVDLEQFRLGLAVEMEHGSHDTETDVIGSDVTLAGKIAWAHLKEIPDYYTRLLKMEHEAEQPEM